MIIPTMIRCITFSFENLIPFLTHLLHHVLNDKCFRAIRCVFLFPVFTSLSFICFLYASLSSLYIIVILNGSSSPFNSSRVLCSQLPNQYARGIPVLCSIAHHNQYCCPLLCTYDHLASISTSCTSIVSPPISAASIP